AVHRGEELLLGDSYAVTEFRQVPLLGGPVRHRRQDRGGVCDARVRDAKEQRGEHGGDSEHDARHGRILLGPSGCADRRPFLRLPLPVAKLRPRTPPAIIGPIATFLALRSSPQRIPTTCELLTQAAHLNSSRRTPEVS